MKKTLLAFLLVLFGVCIQAQQQTNFYATLFYNSTNNTITTTYYINNTANGNCNMLVAVLPLEMQWNPSVLTLQSFNFIPNNAALDLGGVGFDEFPSRPDANTSLSNKNVTVNSQPKTFYRRFYRRSTNLCDNTLNLVCGAYMPVFQAVFTIPAGLASTYNFVTPLANNYIGEFIGTTNATPSNQYRELIFVANRLFDQAGNQSQTCGPGQTIDQINNVPNSQGGEIFVNSEAPLPITLTFFEAYKQNNQVTLKWETATEQSVNGFEVQRMTKGGFETIGFVPSKAFAGNSSEPLSYFFSDNERNNYSTVYYRLKQKGVFDKETYSSVKAVRNTKTLQVLIYPNPSNGNMNIVLPDGNGTTDINMIDFSGRVIKRWVGHKAPGIQLSGLQKGIYTLLVTDRESGEKVSQKITVQ